MERGDGGSVGKGVEDGWLLVAGCCWARVGVRVGIKLQPMDGWGKKDERKGKRVRNKSEEGNKKEDNNGR